MDEIGREWGLESQQWAFIIEHMNWSRGKGESEMHVRDLEGMT